MVGGSRVMALVAATDAERAKQFYGSALGLRLVRQEPIALVFDAYGTMLRVQIVRTVSPHPYTVLGWEVEDMTAAIDDLAEHGVAVERFPGIGQDGDGVWTADDGTRVAWLKDPDGNILSVTQFPESKRLKR